MLPFRRKLKPLARNLRNNATEAEARLWARLRRKQIMGLQFYRQKPIAGDIVDLYCAAAQLVSELDGAQHLEADAQTYDRQRTQVLEAMGLRVLWFDNRQVLAETDAVVEVIARWVAVR